MGTVELTRAILPSMVDRQAGRIVLVCSQAAQVYMCSNKIEIDTLVTHCNSPTPNPNLFVYYPVC